MEPAPSIILGTPAHARNLRLIKLLAERTGHPFWQKALAVAAPVLMTSLQHAPYRWNIQAIEAGTPRPSALGCCELALAATGTMFSYNEGLIIEGDRITTHAWITRRKHHYDPVLEQLAPPRGPRWTTGRRYLSLVELRRKDLDGFEGGVPCLPGSWGMASEREGGFIFQNETVENIIQRFTLAPDRKGIWLVQPG